MDSNSSLPNYKFGVELEMFLVFKRLNPDIENERTVTNNSWEVNNDPSLYPVGIAQCNGCT